MLCGRRPGTEGHPARPSWWTVGESGSRQKVVADGTKTLQSVVAGRDRVSVLGWECWNRPGVVQCVCWLGRAHDRAISPQSLPTDDPLTSPCSCVLQSREGCGLDGPRDVPVAPWALWRKLWSVSLLYVSPDMPFRTSLGLQLKCHIILSPISFNPSNTNS